MTAPIYGVMEYLSGPIVEWRIDCPIHGRVSSVDVADVTEHANHLPYIITAPSVTTTGRAPPPCGLLLL